MVAVAQKIEMFWSELKQIIQSKNLIYQHKLEGGVYIIWAYDLPDMYSTTLYTGDVPWVEGIYTQEQNDADLEDFQNNFLPSSNSTMDKRSSDGRLTVRVTTSAKGKAYRLKIFSTYSSDPSTLHNIDPITDKDSRDCTIRIYNEAGELTENKDDAVKTIIDYEPDHAYEIIGGWIDLPKDLEGLDTNNWFISCIGLPDIKQVAVAFVGELSIEAVLGGIVKANGRSTLYMPYTTYGNPPQSAHTNKIRWVIKHPKGVAKRFQFYTEVFE